MMVTPSMIPDMTLKKSGHVLDSSRSGNTVTRAIWMKPPLVKGMIHEVAFSTTSKEFSPRADSEPTIPTEAVQSWALAASYLSKPDFMRMAKSPISWGISCSRMQEVVTNPVLLLTRKAPPTARPCAKLSTQLATRLR